MQRFHKRYCFIKNARKASHHQFLWTTAKNFIYMTFSLCKGPQNCCCDLIPKCKGSVLLPSLMGLSILCYEGTFSKHMVEERQYKERIVYRMLNLGWKSSNVTDFHGNVSSCDGISRVWKQRQQVEGMREGGLDGLSFQLQASL